MSGSANAEQNSAACCITAAARAAVVGEQRLAALGELQRRDEHRLGAFARHALRGAAEQAGGEALVHAAMADDHQVGGAGALGDLVGDDAHAQRGVGAHAALGRLLGERVEQRAPALFQHAAHLRGEVEVRLEAERARDVVEERALDRDDVDHVQAEHAALQALGQPQGIASGGVGVLRAVETNQDRLDHRSRPLARVAASDQG
ncbi:MAG: hypothetical protein SF182_08330 [Deltaproteobacteria bacterium]|nr:hypothetical protein [Deltaproteobacteria bacterium]